MVQNIRRLLQTQFIGAIIIGWVAVQGVIDALGLILRIVEALYQRMDRGVLGTPTAGAIDGDRVFYACTRIVIYLGFSLWLGWWLYLKEEKPDESEDEGDEAIDDPVSS